MFKKENVGSPAGNEPSRWEKLKRFKGTGEKTVKNRVLLKRGSFSFMITVLTLAVIVLLNFVVSTLNRKVQLEFDMTAKKTNSISAENSKYLKSIEDDIDITVCGKKEDYVIYLLSNSVDLYNVTSEESLLELTLSLLEKYNNINDCINVKYVDMQSVEFTEISQQYSSEKLALGDIIVSSPVGTNKRFKHLTFADVYQMTDSSGYAAYGYSTYDMTANRLESSLTSAISFVLDKQSKSALIYKGHSGQDYSSSYRQLLENNNYTVDILYDPILTEIDPKYDSFIILAPDTDFLGNEIEALSAFLDNGGKYGKGLVFVADALNPELPVLYDFLAEWGIEIHEGILLETNPNAMPNTSTPTALLSFPTNKVSYTKGMKAFVTGYNVPMLTTDLQIDGVVTASAAATLNSAVKAPANATSEWKDYSDSDLKNYDTMIEAKLTSGDKSSYVFAFSSVEFISSSWAETASVFNKDLILAATDRASGKADNAVTFVDKSVSEENYATDISSIDVIRMRRFLFAIPVIIIICGIVIFILRRNAK